MICMPFHWNIIKSEWILSDVSQRLDASFYSRDIGEARIFLDKIRKKNVRITTLNNPSFTSQIFWPERFKRKYTKEDKGKPFLMPKEVFQFLPQARKFIVDFSNNLLVKEKWILITRSGSIGRCLLTNKILSSNFVLSDDLIRIIPADEKEVGYIYAFLNTWIGQAFLTKTQYGETVKHIEPEHVSAIPLPLLQESDIKEINEKILDAHKLREEAQELLLKAFAEKFGIPTDRAINELGGGGKPSKAVALEVIKEWLEPQGYKVKKEEKIETDLTESHRGYTDLVAEKDGETLRIEIEHRSPKEQVERNIRKNLEYSDTL